MIRIYPPAPEKCCYLKLIESPDGSITLIATEATGQAYASGMLLTISSKGVHLHEGISDVVLNLMDVTGTPDYSLPIC